VKNYLAVLDESLSKKITVLTNIKEATFAQKDLLSKEEFDVKEFDSYVDKKETYIEELGKLDEGFDTLYKRVSSELEEHRSDYKDEIAGLKAKISTITELSATIEAQESRNRDMVTAYFAKARSKIGQQRRSNKAAFDYYKSVAGYNGENSKLMDKKK